MKQLLLTTAFFGLSATLAQAAAIERTFTPEFRNRLDAVISFAPLSREVIVQVVEKFILQLEAQLMDRNVHIELTDEAADWLAKNGFDELYGARPLARVIQDSIKKPLADDILFGRLTRGGHVKVQLKDGKIDFDITGPSGTLETSSSSFTPSCSPTFPA